MSLALSILAMALLVFLLREEEATVLLNSQLYSSSDSSRFRKFNLKGELWNRFHFRNSSYSIWDTPGQQNLIRKRFKEFRNNLATLVKRAAVAQTGRAPG